MAGVGGGRRRLGRATQRDSRAAVGAQVASAGDSAGSSGGEGLWRGSLARVFGEGLWRGSWSWARAAAAAAATAAAAVRVAREGGGGAYGAARAAAAVRVGSCVGWAATRRREGGRVRRMGGEEGGRGRRQRQPSNLRKWTAQAASTHLDRDAFAHVALLAHVLLACLGHVGDVAQNHGVLPPRDCAWVQSAGRHEAGRAESTRGRCAAHARAMLHVRSAAHGPVVESRVLYERELDDLNERLVRQRRPHSDQSTRWPHSDTRKRRQKKAVNFVHQNFRGVA